MNRIPIGLSDPRLAPLIALRHLVPMVEFDREERDERRLIRRMEIREAVRR